MTLIMTDWVSLGVMAPIIAGMVVFLVYLSSVSGAPYTSTHLVAAHKTQPTSSASSITHACQSFPRSSPPTGCHMSLPVQSAVKLRVAMTCFPTCCCCRSAGSAGLLGHPELDGRHWRPCGLNYRCAWQAAAGCQLASNKARLGRG